MRAYAKYEGGQLLRDGGFADYEPTDVITLRLQRAMIQATMRERLFESTRKFERKNIADIDRALRAYMKDKAA